MISRRRFMRFFSVFGFPLLCPSLSLSKLLSSLKSPERSLSLYNIHTGERLKTIYWIDGSYIPSSLEELSYILRDFRSGEVKLIDTQLFDLLFLITEKLETGDSIHIISGYRSLQTNTMLWKMGRGVAKQSLHTEGKAIDIRIPKVPLSVLRDVAISLKAGGVGYYPKSGFVHVDVGKVRYW